MIPCGKCGTYIQDGIKFCPSCGQAAELTHEKDAQANKGMAVTAYLLFFIPMLTRDHQKSPFVKFHTNQALVQFIASILFLFVGAFVGILIMMFIPVIGTFLGAVVLAALFVFVFGGRILGIIYAVKGMTKPLPITGKYTLIK